MAVATQGRNRGQQQQRQDISEQPGKTVEWRSWRGVNTTDYRTDIEDTELFWQENAVTVGKGSIQLTKPQGTSIATIAAGITTFTGYTLTLAGVSTDVFITINADGSATQVLAATGAQTVVCGAGVLTTAAITAPWRDTEILFIDPVKGYAKWDGTTFTVVDATNKGTHIAVFQGRVWIFSVRTIKFSAPNSNTDFTAPSGGGSTILTDEAFPGEITSAHSVVEQLWILGDGGIEAISNVVTSGGTTTFSITNVLTGLGTNASGSVGGYFRSLVFSSSTGVWALAGVTPQKLSDKLDGAWPALTFELGAPMAIATVQNLLVLCFLVTYTQSLVPSLPTPASGSSAATPMLICFTGGKWFFATQGALTWITTLIRNKVSEAWGTDGSDIFPLFDGTGTVNYKVVGKLFSFGTSTSIWQVKRSGVEFQATQSVAPVMTVDNGTTSDTQPLSSGNVITFTNGAGAALSFTNAGGFAIVWVTQAFVLSRTVSNMYGNYLGWTLSGTDAPYRITAVQFEYAPSGAWSVL